MKKKILTAILLILTLFITGCTTKEPLDNSNFKAILEKRNFIVIDQTNKIFTENPKIESSYLATTADGRYSLEFYSFDGEISAQAFYAKKQVEFASTGSQAYTEINLGNYSKYTITYHDNYGVISRISNTIIYVNANKEYSDEIKNLLKELNY